MIYQNIMRERCSGLDQSQRSRLVVGALLLGVLMVTAGCAGQYVMGVLGGGTLAYHVLERERFINETPAPVVSLPVEPARGERFSIERFSLDLPTGALGYETTVTVKEDPVPPYPMFTGVKTVGKTYKIFPTHLVFDTAATVTFTYTDSQVPSSVDEIQFHVYRYDIVDTVYKQLPRAAGSSISGNTVTAELTTGGVVRVMTGIYPGVVSALAVSQTAVNLGFDLDVNKESAETEAYYVITSIAGDGSSALVGPPLQSELSGDGRTVILTVPAMQSDLTYRVTVSDVTSIRGYEVDPDTNWMDLSGDWAAPGQIANVAASAGPGAGEVVLTWSSPHENGLSGGAASSYLVRYATSSIDGTSWDSAYTADGMSVPRDPESSETMIISNLTPAVTYYFAVRAVDEASNVSSVSNSPSAVPIP